MNRALFALLVCAGVAGAQTPTKVFSRADTLRGSDGPARSWWDVTFYDLHVTVNPVDSTIRGWNGITFRAKTPAGAGVPAREMQIDLQVPMQIDSVKQGREKLTFRRDSNAYFVSGVRAAPGGEHTVTVYYHGKPRAAVNAPWDGGFIWK